jgi:hypothetical protein
MCAMIVKQEQNKSRTSLACAAASTNINQRSSVSAEYYQTIVAENQAVQAHMLLSQSGLTQEKRKTNVNSRGALDKTSVGASMKRQEVSRSKHETPRSR